MKDIDRDKDRSDIREQLQRILVVCVDLDLGRKNRIEDDGSRKKKRFSAFSSVDLFRM